MYFLRRIFDLLFPRTCCACRAELEANEAGCCRRCLDGIAAFPSVVCGVCHRRTPGSIFDFRCCGTRSYPFVAGSFYENVAVRELVKQLKFSGVAEAAVPLGQMMEAALKKALGEDGAVAILIPMPLHARRARERGYNQAELLAREVATTTGIPVRTDLLTRTRYTKPQSLARTTQERQKNVLDCFAAGKQSDIPPEKIVFVVDDVLTTGATMSAAIAALKAAGYRKVAALVAAA